MTWHHIARAQLASALTEAGPDAPTLCEGWQSRHLAAHLVLREHSPVAGAGIVVPALAAHTEQVIAQLAETARSAQDYRDLVARVAAEPAAWSPLAWAGEQVNLVEFFVHTEDVRRGAGPVPPRELEPEHVEALWRALVRGASLTYRRVPVGIVLVRPDGVRRRVRRAPSGHGTVVIRGAVGELLLHAFGRGAAVDIRIEGAPDDVEALAEVLPNR
ncbi:MAG TPA: TIGR03085 family metal-binding protein [Cellulomonas sp.]|uniref:TIGR03085 family metal-binding protein n=1 Tax=Cellulomonas sp. TaxID=40001 RepID=UPI002E3512C6|nr:TIGR03085 family metal-binding protein [Cellulomonas sp.]HEX5331782.1 TIGR03085 family metal-binding protein [Cellulomonas sp.]